MIHELPSAGATISAEMDPFNINFTLDVTDKF